MKKCAGPKPKRSAPAKRTKVIRDISPDGQLEVRGDDVLIYEPLASKVKQYCKRHGISLRKFWAILCSDMRKRLEHQNEEAKAAKVKKPKTQRAKHHDELI